MAWMTIEIRSKFGTVEEAAVNTDTITQIQKMEGRTRLFFTDGREEDVSDDYDEIINVLLTADAKKKADAK